MSSLLEPDFSLAPSETVELISANLHSKKIAPIWKHSRRPRKDENQTFLYCFHCKLDSETPPYGTSLAGNLTKHIKRKHPTITIEKTLSKNQEAVNRQIKQLYHEAQVLGETEKFNIKIFKACLDTTIITETLISLIVVRNLSYTLVKWPEFHTLCQVLNRASKDKIITSHSGIANKVKETWGKHKDVIRRALQSALSHIHISLDIWTSPNRYLFLAICAHFTTYDQKRQKAFFALKKVPGHNENDQFSILFPILENYGIARKLGTIIANNVPFNNTLCVAIQNH
jgi:hypothetical protein